LALVTAFAAPWIRITANHDEAHGAGHRPLRHL